MRSSLLAVLALLSLSAPVARADVMITVAPSVGPNLFGSPSYTVYRDNALAALATGAATAGTPGTPGFYQSLPTGAGFTVTDIIVTDFPSWRGNADPGSAFGPEFAGEVGTRLYFGLRIFPIAGTPATQFSISQLSFVGVTTDPLQTLDFGFPAGEYEYSDDYIGLLLNPDGSIRGRITSGPNTQLVDALIGRGSTNAYEILSTDPGATNQDKINDNLPVADFRFTGTYSLGDKSGSAEVFVASVPAPPSVVMLGFGLAALGLRWRRTR